MRRWHSILLLIAGIGLAYFAVDRGLLSSRAAGAAKDAAPAIPTPIIYIYLSKLTSLFRSPTLSENSSEAEIKRLRAAE